MKVALPATLTLGVLSLLVAMMAAFMFYVDWVGQSKLQATVTTTTYAEAFANAQDFATLKQGCIALARRQDNNVTFLHEQAALIKAFANGIFWFCLVWGLVCGGAFLYVHFLLRRVVKSHGL
jgi:hypothetical protein